ncbi:hypothetical protein MYXO_01062 [Myxococcaceae bacterium]|nr:hypothetical protein MYXO_01062 [Myxococcaceae bacterium]
MRLGRVGAGLVAALAWVVLGTAAPAAAVTVDWVFVGDPGNAADTPASNCYAASCGSVSHGYYISKYEVTNAQYAEFLNAKAATDPNGLYNGAMASSTHGGITRSGGPGSYSYAVKSGMASKPVNYVSFWDATRFTNWLGNGEGSGDTETGAYTLTPAAISANSVVRNLGAQVFLPSENEWYKAAYYDPIANLYYDYPAGTNVATICSSPTGVANHANCSAAAATLTGAGSYPGSASPNGTFDQGGNVDEWNEQVVSGPYRGHRGGSWSFGGGGAAALSAAVPGRYSPSVEGDFLGFRVAMIPEPSTGLLVAAGVATLAARRRRPPSVR